VRHPERHAADIVHRDGDTITIRDKFAKAQHHYLVMPTRELDSLSVLTRADLPVLDALIRRGKSMAEECVLVLLFVRVVHCAVVLCLLCRLII
jgi:diadenosine tetraphosphate (Ap4A) HIT family hydrolase